MVRINSRFAPDIALPVWWRKVLACSYPPRASLGAGRCRFNDARLPIIASTQILYNPDMNDKWFVIPGIIGMILQTLAIEQAAIFLVRDREWGTMEQILSTPVTSVGTHPQQR